MKHNDIQDAPSLQKIPPEALENIFNVYVDGQNEYYYNILRTVNFEGLENLEATYFDIHVFNEEDSWTVLSFKYYGTTRLWWLICKVNNIFNPFENPEIGTKLIILKPELVHGLVLEQLRYQ